MYRIAKDVTFAASHVLDGLPEGHKCGRLHGHNYRVEVELSAPVLDDVGMVRDYAELTPLLDHIRERFDHRHLNDALLGNPTAENLARVIFEWALDDFPEVSAVRVHETDRTVAEYRP